MKLFNPAPGRPITSPFGMRKHPTLGTWKMHNGIDYGGTFDVLAAGDGIVVHVSKDWNTLSKAQKARQTGGNVVIIQHANDLFSVYYHGASQSTMKVGDRVRAGQLVYRSGSTGRSTGPHLHFETRTKKSSGHKDPQIYLTGSVPDVPNSNGGYKVAVAVSGKANKETWKAWQTALKAKWKYTGILDGVPGRMTWSAIQRSCGKHYKGQINGVPDANTRRAVQNYLKDLGAYTGAIDGIWGRGTWSAIQRSLNEGKY